MNWVTVQHETDKDSAKLALREGVRVIMRAHTGSANSSRTEWFVAGEVLEEDTRIVGVVDDQGSMVMGDCMSDVNNEVTEAHARHVALMDPRFMWMILELFRRAIEEIDLIGLHSPVVQDAVAMARHLGKKWKKEVTLL